MHNAQYVCALSLYHNACIHQIKAYGVMYKYNLNCADMMKLAAMSDLGSGEESSWGFESPYPHKSV